MFTAVFLRTEMSAVLQYEDIRKTESWHVEEIRFNCDAANWASHMGYFIPNDNLARKYEKGILPPTSAQKCRERDKR